MILLFLWGFWCFGGDCQQVEQQPERREESEMGEGGHTTSYTSSSELEPLWNESVEAGWSRRLSTDCGHAGESLGKGEITWSCEVDVGRPDFGRGLRRRGANA